MVIQVCNFKNSSAFHKKAKYGDEGDEKCADDVKNREIHS